MTTYINMAHSNFTEFLGWLSRWKTKTMYNDPTPNYFCCPIFGRDLMLARLATSHALGGAYTPSCAAKKDSYPGESKANPVCFDISGGS